MNNYKLYIYLLLFITIPLNGQVGNLSSSNQDRIAIIDNNLQALFLDVPGLTEKVNVTISNTSLTNFLKAISQVHKINMNLSKNLSSITVINGFRDVTVHELLLFLAKEHTLQFDFTGTIISIKKYIPPIATPVVKEIGVSYEVATNSISLDLTNDPLPKVFRKINQLTGKNLLFEPELGNKNLSIYLTDTPVDLALKKLAETNEMEVIISENGFFEFIKLDKNLKNSAFKKFIASKRDQNNSVPFTIVDSNNKIVSIDVKDVMISDIIYAFSEELDLNIFIATPLEHAGKLTYKTERIHFDDLLVEIFEKAVRNKTPINSQNNRSDIGQLNNISNPTANTQENFTFKKKGNTYYFGTKDQLSIRTIERVHMMHRSIEMLGDANSSSGVGNNFNSQNFITGGTNFYGTSNDNIAGQNNFSTINTRNYNQNSQSNTSQNAITSLFPSSITEGLEIKIDTELNSFIVSGSGLKVKKFRDFVKYIDTPIPLILIEVMILEVNRSATVETGVEFGIGKESTVTEGVTYPDASITLGAQTINRIIGGFDGFGSLNLGNVVPNFYMDIKAMESNGNVKILSTPKLSTLNGHKAFLSSGQTTYYAVTNQNFFGSQIPQTSQTINYQPINAELALEFKPYVAGDGQITLDIQVIQSSFSGNRIAEDAPPDINSRSFSSIMRMRANDVAILGGIEQKVKNDSGTGVPLLSRIPILKWIFSKRKREDSRKKLNIIIKPTVFY
ncbi:type II secretion system protein GspD [Aquimarina sp. W85]|uniref:type II secretion system protein GspD n=1 Tax=Aquimarina rhodophyticola TaxID=3342246 RepID=UPI00366D2A1C